MAVSHRRVVYAAALVPIESRAMSALDSEPIRQVERIRQVLRDHAQLPVDVDSIDKGTDLFDAGMDSHVSINVMLALEATFDIEFPEAMLERSVFESIAALDAAVRELRAQAP